MRERKRKLWHETRWDGLPGFGNAFRRLLYQFEGAAQLGDPNEPAYVPPANPKCPVCNEPMKEHQVTRGGPSTPTLLRCPSPASEVAATPKAATPKTTEPPESTEVP